MEGEWGPLVLHDGRGCPVIGKYAQVRCADGRVAEGVVMPHVLRGRCVLWVWATLCPAHWPMRVVAYRVRKPRALLDLIDLVENLPAPAKRRVGA
jgi:hypothetical protein